MVLLLRWSAVVLQCSRTAPAARLSEVAQKYAGEGLSALGEVTFHRQKNPAIL